MGNMPHAATPRMIANPFMSLQRMSLTTRIDDLPNPGPLDDSPSKANGGKFSDCMPAVTRSHSIPVLSKGVPMVDPALLEILVCPETRQPVRPANEDLLGRLNEAIRAGGVTNRGGNTVEDSVDEGLVREDGKVLYPVREDIPIMLIDEAIEVDHLS